MSPRFIVRLGSFGSRRAGGMEPERWETGEVKLCDAAYLGKVKHHSFKCKIFHINPKGGKQVP